MRCVYLIGCASPITVATYSMSSFQALRAKYASLLKRFISSTKEFEVLTTIPPNCSPPDILYVLDSSFNPPTLAHLRIASSALQERLKPSSRLLLLLSTQNADKPSKPAPFEDRLAMMELFAHDLRSLIATTTSSATSSELARPEETLPSVDIGVTKRPYFVDKSAAIETSDSYPSPLEQVHLTGYDTLIRIFNTKYYPPEHTLQPLSPLFTQHWLRVTMRPDDEWGSREEQQDFLAGVARGDRESEGGRREWAQRIKLVEGKAPEEQPVSSTKAREAAQSATEDLDWLVPERVREYVLSERPYTRKD